MNSTSKYLLLLLVAWIPRLMYAQELKRAEELITKAERYIYTNPKQASYCAMKASSLLGKGKHPALQAKALLLYSDAEQLLGNFDLSIKSLYDVDKYLDGSDRVMEAKVMLLKGRVYGKLGDYNRAIELNNRATEVFKALGDSTAIAACYNERGVIHHFMNEDDISEKFLKRALNISRIQRHLRGVASVLNNLCLSKGNADEKIQMLHEAIAINKNVDAQWALGENYNNLGNQYYYAHRYEEALEALQTALGYITQLGARELLSDNYEYRAMVEAAMGNYRQAYASLGEMFRIKSEWQSTTQLRNVEQEIAYKQMKDQQTDAELIEREYRIAILRRNLLILCIVLLMAAMLFFWYKRSKNRKLTQAEESLLLSRNEVNELKLRQQEMELQAVQAQLESSRQDLTSIAVFLQSRSELLDKIRDLIKEGYKMDSTALVPHLKRINAFISQSQGGDPVGNSLLLTLEEKNKEFTRHLLDLHPDLTPGEQHLATLLRVNLGTKEIAMLMGTTAKTIHMNRYRLRKSLGLQAEQDLVEYLQHI